MVSTILSLALIFGIAIFAVLLVMNFGKPIIDMSKSSSDLNSAEISMKFLDNYLRETAQEGNGSVRLYNFIAPKSFTVIKGEDAAVYSGEISNSLFDFNTRSQQGGFLYIGGSDVSCYEADGNGDGLIDLIMENSFVKFAFNWTARTTPLSNIDTTTAILNMTQKTTGTSIIPANASIQINSNSSTSKGTGYSELLRTGKALPFCTAHFLVNGTTSYDVYYRLYSGADYLTIYVRNIR